MEVVENAQFPRVLISKLEYRNQKFCSNDPLGKTEINFTLLKDYFTFQLTFKDQKLLNTFIDSLAKAKNPQRIVVRNLYYNFGTNMKMD